MKNGLTLSPSFRQTSSGWLWPLLMVSIRLPLALAGSGIAILAYQLAGRPAGAAAGLAWSTLTMTVINLLCLWLLAWRSRVEGFSLGEMIGFRASLLPGDVLWGLVYSLLLGALLLAGIFAVMFALTGGIDPAGMEAFFVGAADFSLELPAWLALVSAVAFPLLNPVVEELQYRGYAQPRLIAASSSTRSGILITSAGFGLQHVVYALTLPSALAFAAGFFLWGLGAGLIAHRQQRLARLIVAHFISNLSFGVIPLIIVAGGF